MSSLLPLLGLALLVFISTNLDDIFVLLGLFADPRFRSRDIISGQFIGIGVLYAVCVLGSLISLVLPPMWIGLLGVLPLAMGCHKLLALRHGAEDNEAETLQERRRGHWSGWLQVALVTLANGGDNIGVYTPVFATRSAFEIAVFGLVFAVMTALWCLMARWMVHHPALGQPLRRHGRWLTPLVLILLGLSILHEAGSMQLLIG